MLTGKSLDVIARRRKLTYERIRQRAKAALDLLHQKLEAWQVSQQQLNDLDAKASQMEAELEVRAKQIEELQQDARQHVKEASQGLIRLDPKAAKALTSTMIDIGMPTKIVTKLANRGIYTVLDAASLTKRQLIDKGASLKALDMLRLKLLSLGLDFGSDIRRVPGLDEYYIFPKPSSDVNKEPEAILPAPQVNEYEDKYLEAQEQIKALEKQVAKQDRQVERLKDKLSQMEVIVSQPYKIALEEKKNVIKDLRQDLRDSKRAVVERKKQIVRLEQVNERIIEELEAAKNVQIFLNKFDDRPQKDQGDW